MVAYGYGYGYALNQGALQGGDLPDVYMTDFPADSGVHSSLYGPQASHVQKLVASDGTRNATTYVDLMGTDRYNFLRDLIVHNGSVLVLGQSRYGDTPGTSEVSIATMSLDLSTLHDTWSCGETGSSEEDGQPALVSNGTNIWAAFSVDGAIDATGSGGGYDTVFDASITTRLVVCKFAIDGSNNLTLVNHTYIQDSSASGDTFGETHCISLTPTGNILVGAECSNSFGGLPGTDYRSYDSTAPGTRKGFVMELSEDLATIEYASFYGDSALGSDAYFDGSAVDGDGNYAMAFTHQAPGDWKTGKSYVVNDVRQNGGSIYRCNTAHTSGATFAGDSANWDAYTYPSAPTTDGSTHPSPTTNSGALVVFDRWHQLVFASYINDSNAGSSWQSAVRRAVFDPNGNIYAGGWQGLSSPDSPTARLWKFTKATNNTFDRALNDDVTYLSESMTTLGVTNGVGFEIKYTPNLQANATIFAIGGSNDAKILLTHSGAGTALSALLWFDGGTAVNAGANALVAGTEYTLRAIWDGSTGEAQL